MYVRSQRWEAVVDASNTYDRPIPKRFKTSFNLSVERLRALGFQIEEASGHERYRVDGAIWTRRQVMDLAARKLVLVQPPDNQIILAAEPGDIL